MRLAERFVALHRFLDDFLSRGVFTGIELFALGLWQCAVRVRGRKHILLSSSPFGPLCTPIVLVLLLLLLVL